jgi:5'-methylthioadenosine phosphorylase
MIKISLFQIPAAEYAIVGGSATANCHLPEDAGVPGVRVVESNLIFDTPFGPTTEFKLLELEAGYTADGKTHHALEVRMHGWRKGYNWATSAGPRQVFWTLKLAGVKKIIGNAGVGGINRLLEGGDVVIADDYLDYTQGRPSSLEESWPNSVSMVEPYCAAGRALLAEQALAKFRRVHRVGIMGCSNGPYIESLAQVAVMRGAGADIVAQSTVPCDFQH